MVAPYTPDIPQPDDNPSVSQSEILNNFTSLNEQFEVDHVALTDASLNGFHTQTTFSGFTTFPGPNPISYPQGRLLTRQFGDNTPGNPGTEELFFFDSRQNANPMSATNLQRYVVNAKAISRFLVPAANGACTIIANNSLNYNVASVTRITANSYSVTFTSQLDYNSYQVNFSFFRISVSGTGTFICTNQTTTGFSFINISSGAGPSTGDVIGFMII